MVSLIVPESQLFIGSLRLNPTLVHTVAWVSIGFFGLCLVWLLYRQVIRKPLLIISSRGVYDNASAVGVGWVEWSEIKDIKIVEQKVRTLFANTTHRYIGIIPHNLEEILARTNPIKRAALRLNVATKLVETPINLPTILFSERLEEVLQKINSTRKAQL